MVLRFLFSLLAAALLLCCSQFEFDNPYDPDNWKSSSGRSMIVQSSSSRPSSFGCSALPKLAADNPPATPSAPPVAPPSPSPNPSTPPNPPSPPPVNCESDYNYYADSRCGGYCTCPNGLGCAPSSSSQPSSSSSSRQSSSSSSRPSSSSSSATPSSSSSLLPSSSSAVPSSSSVTPSSSSATPSSSSGGYAGSYGSLAYQGRTYKTVAIGGQVWMAENLNYDVAGSACYDCSQYGRLYDWATAMALPSSCNSSICTSQVSAKHRGVCPSGWHIPSDDDWEALFSYVGGSSVAGKHLKATSGWYDWDGYSSGNGLDMYGFAALPGGDGCLGAGNYGYSGGGFNGAGNYGFWWSASERDSSSAYIRNIYYDNEHATWRGDDKTLLRSVRCVED